MSCPPHRGAVSHSDSVTWRGGPANLCAPLAGPSREPRARGQPGAHSGHIGAAGHEVLWPQDGPGGAGVDGGGVLGERGVAGAGTAGPGPRGRRAQLVGSLPPRSPEASCRPPQTPGWTASGSGNPHGPHSRTAGHCPQQH